MERGASAETFAVAAGSVNLQPFVLAVARLEESCGAHVWVCGRCGDGMVVLMVLLVVYDLIVLVKWPFV